ncbi:MAG: ATP-dependent zinc protease [Nitrospirota bacterium]|nr:ATP-dependent zinc protease [Nitrospirota bacterium]
MFSKGRGWVLLVGWNEWVALPGLGVSHIKAKVDTGARTSALHAFDVERYQENGTPMARFAIHPLQRRDDVVVRCTAPLVDERVVTNSGGHRERRPVVRTTLRLGGTSWDIEVTLTNRDEMGFRMLLGRTAMERRLIVDPSASCLTGGEPRRDRRPR